MPYKNLTCKKCGVQFKVGVAYKGNVCSECKPIRKNFHRRIVTCPVCGQLFETIRSNQKYCCKSCKEDARVKKHAPKERVEKICNNPYCKKAFLAKRNQKYCSKECAKIGAKVFLYERARHK